MRSVFPWSFNSSLGYICRKEQNIVNLKTLSQVETTNSFSVFQNPFSTICLLFYHFWFFSVCRLFLYQLSYFDAIFHLFRLCNFTQHFSKSSPFVHFTLTLTDFCTILQHYSPFVDFLTIFDIFNIFRLFSPFIIVLFHRLSAFSTFQHFTTFSEFFFQNSSTSFSKFNIYKRLFHTEQTKYS